MNREKTSGEIGGAVVADVAQPGSQRSYVDWPAIIGGVVMAFAITSVLATFGSGIGLSMTGSPWDPNMSAGWFLAAGALWFIWVQISSVMAGGYLAGRLRHRFTDSAEHEVEMRDGAHGLLVWGVSVLVGALLALNVVSGGVSTAVKTAGVVAESATAMADGGPGGVQVEDIVARLFRPAVSSGTSPARVSPPRTDSAAAQADVQRIVAMAAVDGEIADVDKTYIAEIVAERTGLTVDEARERVDGQLAQSVSDLRDATETARKTGIIAAFLTAATLLVSALAGWWAAGVGGRHRDENIDLIKWFRFR